MTSWRRGRTVIQRLLDDSALDRVRPSAKHARRLLSEARTNLASAKVIAPSDPSGSLHLAYDAARKASTALLAVQGLRPTSRGGHRAVQDAVSAQFGGPFRDFARMRRQRNRSEYPTADSPTVTADDATDAVTRAAAMFDRAHELVETGEIEAW